MCDTVRMQPGRRSTSDPMFIRVSPLFVYLHSQYFHTWHFESPVVKRSASLKIPSIMLPFSSRTHLKNMHSQCASAFRPHVYQGFPYVYIYYTVSSTICTYFVARYKYSLLVIGTAPYFGSSFIVKPSNNHATLSTHPIFPYLTFWVARWKMFRHGLCAALCGCNLVEDSPQTSCL